jgi:hypothetical protein
MGAELRESVRIAVGLWCRPYDCVDFVPTRGNISLGGARATLPLPPGDEQMEVLLDLGHLGEVRVQARLLEVIPRAVGVDVRMQFVDVTLEDELVLARFIDAVTQEARLWDALAAA